MAYGYIALHRKITHNSFYFSEKFTRMHAWIDLLLLAGYNRNIVFIKGTKIDLKAGELCYSQRTLAERWKWDRNKVSKFLALLSEENMIAIKTSSLTTAITIIKWDEYQKFKPHYSHSFSTNNNDNKEKKEDWIYLNNLPTGCV